MLDAHVCEAGKVAKEPAADQSQQWPNVHLGFLFGNSDSQFLNEQLLREISMSAKIERNFNASSTIGKLTNTH